MCKVDSRHNLGGKQPEKCMLGFRIDTRADNKVEKQTHNFIVVEGTGAQKITQQTEFIVGCRANEMCTMVRIGVQEGDNQIQGCKMVM